MDWVEALTYDPAQQVDDSPLEMWLGRFYNRDLNKIKIKHMSSNEVVTRLIFETSMADSFLLPERWWEETANPKEYAAEFASLISLGASLIP